MQRLINRQFEAWKSSPQRKVLLVRGARQVGKTYSVREFGETYNSYLEVNFLESAEVGRFFQSGNLSPRSLLEKLQIYYGKTIIPGQTLLFFDEIQACPEALTALRFFYEQMPELHVVAAGSLLEFALQEIPSHGVGRIESIFMYPLSFKEFLNATDNQLLAQAIDSATTESALDLPIYGKAVDLFKIYSIIGGLPQIVKAFIDTKDTSICLSLIEDLLLGYEDDFAKYKTRISSQKLKDVLTSSARQAGGKFVYSHVNPGSNISGYDQALQLLELAGLVYRVYKTAANGVPLGAQVDRKSFKVIPFDLGIYNKLLNLNPSQIIIAEPQSFVHLGALAEVACGCELISHASPRQRAALYYWSRDVRGTNAEVDYIIQYKERLVPIEVKAGTKGKMQSLYRFLDEKQGELAIRCSLENFSQYRAPSGNSLVKVIPIFAIGSCKEIS